MRSLREDLATEEKDWRHMEMTNFKSQAAVLNGMLCGVETVRVTTQEYRMGEIPWRPFVHLHGLVLSSLMSRTCNWKRIEAID